VKDKIKSMLQSFFICVTLINVAMLVLGMILMPEQQFGYEVFVYPLIYGLIGMIPALIVRDGKELTVKQTVIKEVIQMVLTVVLLVAFIFGGKPLDSERIQMAALVALSVALVYAGVITIGWLLDKKTADMLNEDLNRFKQRSMS
jgi:hypothetical protein